MQKSAPRYTDNAEGIQSQFDIYDTCLFFGILKSVTKVVWDDSMKPNVRGATRRLPDGSILIRINPGPENTFDFTRMSRTLLHEMVHAISHVLDNGQSRGLREVIFRRGLTGHGPWFRHIAREIEKRADKMVPIPRKYWLGADAKGHAHRKELEKLERRNVAERVRLDGIDCAVLEGRDEPQAVVEATHISRRKKANMSVPSQLETN
ncbi:MAG: hypothetical protein Q9225_003678 [Loekoesia sp. 1 TL-2023]